MRKHLELTNNPSTGCITTADHLTSIGGTCIPRPKRLGGSSSSTVRCSNPARHRRPLEECEQPASSSCCFTGHSSHSHSSRAAAAAGRRRRRWATDGQPSTQRCPATTSLSTTTASQHCANHQLQPGRRRVEETLSSASLGRAVAKTSFTIPSCSSVVPSVHFMSIHSAVLLRKIIFRARDSSPE